MCRGRRKFNADSPEDESKPDFALRATAVGAGHSKGMVFACVGSSEDKIILRIEWIIVRPAGSVDKVIPQTLWGFGARTGNPKDKIAVRVGGLGGGFVTRDGGPGKVLALELSSPSPSSHALKLVRLQDSMASARAIFSRFMDYSAAVLAWKT